MDRRVAVHMYNGALQACHIYQSVRRQCRNAWRTWPVNASSASTCVDLQQVPWYIWQGATIGGDIGQQQQGRCDAVAPFGCVLGWPDTTLLFRSRVDQGDTKWYHQEVVACPYVDGDCSVALPSVVWRAMAIWRHMVWLPRPVLCSCQFRAL